MLLYPSKYRRQKKSHRKCGISERKGKRRDEAEGVRREMKSQRTWHITAECEDGGREPEAKQCGWYLETENNLANKEMGTSVRQPHRTDFCHNLISLKVDSPSALPKRNISLPTPWFLSCETWSRRIQANPHLWPINDEVIDLCCFKPLILW